MLNGFRTKLNGFRRELNGLGTKLNGLRRELNGFRTTLNGLGTTLNALWTMLNGLGTKLNGLGTTLNGLGKRPIQSLAWRGKPPWPRPIGTFRSIEMEGNRVWRPCSSQAGPTGHLVCCSLERGAMGVGVDRCSCKSIETLAKRR